jgi:glucosamine-6-phosphate deaminase
MRILRFDNVNDLATQLDKDLREKIWSHGGGARPRIFLPTGKSPKALYSLLRKNKTFWLERFDIIQIDEFIDNRRPFFNELKSEIANALDLKILAWDPNFSKEEIKLHVESILQHPIALGLLGLGINGHVGFHEPGIPPSFEGGKIVISEDTRSHAKGSTYDVLTFGVGAFLKAKELIMIVTGNDKAEVFSRLQDSEPSDDLPASFLKGHRQFTVYTDLK